MEEKVEQKKKKLFDKIIDGDWVDNLVKSWGKPKSYNKEWNQ